MTSALVTLIQNEILLLTIIGILDLVINRENVNDNLQRKIVADVSLGGIYIRLMPFSIRLKTDIIFDTCSVLLSLSGLFFGLISTIFAINKSSAYPFGLAVREHRQGSGGSWRLAVSSFL